MIGYDELRRAMYEEDKSDTPVESMREIGVDEEGFELFLNEIVAPAVVRRVLSWGEVEMEGEEFVAELVALFALGFALGVRAGKAREEVAT